jgi:SAM-dependent methyltransferase
MPEMYDAIAADYQASKRRPWRTHIESYTLFDALGDVRGLRVLDLACGEGFYSRRLAQAGAAEVVAIDISPAMIDLARGQEERSPLGVQYLVGDVGSLDLARNFDVVVGVYLLHYARSAQTLGAMCGAISRHLAPGGRFITLNGNPDQRPETGHSTRPYGFIADMPADPVDGDTVHCTVFVEDRQISFENYWLSMATHEEQMLRAGLVDFAVHPPRVSPEGLASVPAGHYDAFVNAAPIVLMRARKPCT